MRSARNASFAATPSQHFAENTIAVPVDVSLIPSVPLSSPANDSVFKALSEYVRLVSTSLTGAMTAVAPMTLQTILLCPLSFNHNKLSTNPPARLKH
jgi:hypothetical protein